MVSGSGVAVSQGTADPASTASLEKQLQQISFPLDTFTG